MTAALERNGASKPTLIQLVSFYGRERTSFVRAVEGIFAAAAETGWRRELALPREAAGAEWASEVQASGVAIHEAPEEDIDAWVAGLADRAPGQVVLHSHFTDFDLAAARAAARNERAHAVWHFHTVLGRSPAMLSRHAAKMMLARRLGVAAIVCPSEAMRSALVRRGAPRGRVHVLHSALDLDAFPLLDSARRAAARESLGLPAEAVLLLHFGWDWKIKGGDRFLEVVRLLRAEGIEALGITRADPQAGADRHIREAGMEEWVRVQPPCEPWEMFGAADALMATSRGEGLPFTVLESLAMGTPVVATDIPGHRLLAGAPACRIAAAGADGLAEAVRGVLGRAPDEADAEARASRRWIAERYSLDAYADRMLELYRSLAGSGQI